VDAVLTHPMPKSASPARLPETVRAFLAALGFDTPTALAAAAEAVFCDIDPATAHEAALLAYAKRRVADWFAVILDLSQRDDEAILSIGRAAYLLARAGTRWPEHFLSEDPLPHAMVAALHHTKPQPLPLPQPAAMVDQPLDSVLDSDTIRRLLGGLDPASTRG
jgi:hypothetical protein